MVVTPVIAPVPISMLGRFYIYALHGFLAEITFTAICEFVVTFNWKLQGVSSVSSFFIYGIAILVIERMYLYLNAVGIPLLLRAVLYTMWSYIWEFSTGWVLTQFNACPWDYSYLPYNVMGLITFAYAPAWYMATICLDLSVIPYTLQLAWMDIASTCQ